MLGRYAACNQKVDMTFVLDESGSIDNTEWALVKKFAAAVASAFKNDPRYGIVTFDSKARTAKPVSERSGVTIQMLREHAQQHPTRKKQHQHPRWIASWIRGMFRAAHRGLYMVALNVKTCYSFVHWLTANCLPTLIRCHPCRLFAGGDGARR